VHRSGHADFQRGPLDVQAAERWALRGEQAGEGGCLAQAGDVHGCDEGEAWEGALVGEADAGVQVEEGAVGGGDCDGRDCEEGGGGFTVPFLADEQAVDVALVLAGLG